MVDASLSPMTVDEFLVWAEGRPGRYGLDAGRVLAMAPERIGHVLAKTAAFDALSAAVARSALPCRALPDGAAVKIDATTLYEPDALVFCGAMPPRKAVAIVAPVIVVEVLSPTTGAMTVAARSSAVSPSPACTTITSSTPSAAILVHHARRGDEIATRILRSGSLVLDPPGLALAVEELFGAEDRP